MAPRRFYIIDGHAQIFRAYHAIRGGMNSPETGEPTQAVFGFADMLLRVLLEHRPDYLAMPIDLPGPTFRDEIYDQYKATREPTPADLRAQEQRIFEMCRLFGIPLLACERAEADDVIATIVRQLRKDPETRDVEVRIISKDKDLEQLLDEHTCLYDIHTDATIDLETLKRDKGLEPSQVVDALAMIGDKVDNIPGVDGVGPKTAAKLIGRFGTLDNLLANTDQLKGKQKENVEKAAGHLSLSRQLVQLKDDCNLEFKLEDARIGPVDIAGLRALFRTLGFRRHGQNLERLADILPVTDEGDTGDRQAMERLKTTSEDESVTSADDGFRSSLFGEDDEGPAGPSEAAPGPSASDDDSPLTPEGDYGAVTTREGLDALVEQLNSAELISFDTETIGLGHAARICGLSFATEPGKAVYVPLISPEQASHFDGDTVWPLLRPVFADPHRPKVGHNLKYDILVLAAAGVPVRGAAFDTMVASHLLGEDTLGMAPLAEKLLGRRKIPISRLIGQKQRGQPETTMDQVPLDRITAYAAEDADVALQLYHALRPKLSEQGIDELVSTIEMPLVEVLAEMERHGIRVEPAILDQQKKPITERIDYLRDRIHDLAGYKLNLDSPKQLAKLLFEEMKLPVIKRLKTGPSTDMEVLEKLADMDELTPEQAQLPALIVEYRQLTKLTSTYLEALKKAIDPATRRIHATFHQTVTATGRLSSSDPNLQNIPIRTDIGRQIRKAFVAEAGHLLVAADYSQIELRILAHLSEDPALCEAFNSGLDIHTAVASQVFNVPVEQVSKQQRTHAKTINFGIVYGVTPYGLARRIEGLDTEGAKKLISDYRSRYAGIDRFLQQCIEHAREHGYVRTMYGRRRRITQASASSPTARALGERLAINTVVQGSAAELIKKAMVTLHRRIADEDLPMKMLLQIHDELVIESPQGEAAAMADIVQREMVSAMDLRIPLEVDVATGPSWYEAG